MEAQITQRTVRKWIAFLLGCAASTWGLFSAWWLANLNVDGFFVSSVAMASITGFLGCALYPVSRNVGGLLMLAGGVSALDYAVYAPSLLLLVFSMVLGPIDVLGLGLILSGLLAIPRTRRVLAKWHHAGWLP